MLMFINKKVMYAQSDIVVEGGINAVPVLTYSLLQDNYTALHIAVESAKPAVVETLLGYGADVHVTGEYIFICCSVCDQGSCMPFLIYHVFKWSHPHCVCIK
jgi:hypothetical protein